MKKKMIMASAIALALMASPLESLIVSAEEGGTTPASEGIRVVASSERIAFETPTNLQLSADLSGCSFDYPVGNAYGNLFTHIWIYRDNELIHEYKTLGDSSSLGYVYIQKGSSGTVSIKIPLYQYNMEASGSYSFKVRMESQWPDCLAVSETSTSSSISYSHPGQALGTTVGYWDTEKDGLFHYNSVENATGYEFRLYKQDENSGEWKPCILNTPTDGLLSSPGHKSVFSSITVDSSKDAGGEDKTRDFSNDIFNNSYNTPAGRYCVTVKALSGNPSEISNGTEGAKSNALLIESNSEQDSDSDSSQENNLSALGALIEAAQDGDLIRMDGVNTLSCSDVRQLLDHGMTLEMEYTYEGIDYKVRIPAGASIDESIPYYGPLYLAQYYGVSRLSGPTAAAGGPSYTIQKGDTLGRIARANHMSLAELKAKNPQIKDVDVIFPGQTIQIK